MKANSRRQRYAGQAKRAIVALIVSFIACNLGMALWVDQYRPEIRDPEFRGVLDTLKARRQEHPQAELTLFLGSSRIALGVDAGLFSTPSHVVFNFGMAGAGPYMMDVYWDRLVAEGITPQVVILEVMHPFYNAASGRLLDHSFLDGSRLSVQEAQALVSYGKRSSGPLRRFGFARLFPIARNAQEINECLGIGALNTGHERGEFEPVMDRYGYRPLPVPEEKQEQMRHLAHKQYDQYYPQFSLAPGPAERLRQLISKMQSRGVTIKLLLTPEGSEFRELASPMMNLAIDEFTKNLHHEYGCELIDARDWLPDGAFYDQHHLLPESARQFAERLKPFVLKMTR